MRIAKITLTFWRIVLGIMLLVGAYATVVRFILGLGPATGLSDKFPWGIWIGFDVVAGVGLAAGGFTLASVVYVFRLEKYRPILRPTILTAFLGYILAVISLNFDIGRPWNIWHPIVFHNFHSVMFEVAWCVMLYNTVLALEFIPAVLERFHLGRPLKLLHMFTPPIVIVGVLLSTLHQSSLGTLFVIVPAKVHGLWYTPYLPLLFYISAIGIGLAMTIFESTISHRAFGTSLHKDILKGLAKAASIIFSIYLAVRFFTIAREGNLGLIFEGTLESNLFITEIVLGFLLPIILLSMKRVKDSEHGMFYTAVLAILGFVLNRINVSITGMERYTGNAYFPSFLEVATTLFVIALGMIAFGLIARYFPIFPVETGEEHADPHGHVAYASLEEQREQKALVQNPRVATPAGALFFGGIAVVLAVVLYVIKPDNAPIRYDSKVPQPGLFTASFRKIDTEHTVGGLKLPADYKYPTGPVSPGYVTFSHKAHVTANEEACTNCHLDVWQMKRPVFKNGTVDSTKEHKKCGTCHDGKRSFDMGRECNVCHVPAGEAAKNVPSFQRLGLAADIVIRSGSPGIGSVLFRHETHVKQNQYRCSECHPRIYRMIVSGEPKGGLKGMTKRMEQGHRCGSCHNGQVGFNLADNCKSCHSGSSGKAGQTIVAGNP